jgi:two-component system, OmpR family, response regulator RegX3
MHNPLWLWQIREIFMRLALLQADPGQAEPLRCALENAGHRVHFFEDHRDLLRDASRESFDLFLVEWNTTGVKGTRLLTRLRSLPGGDSSVIFINCSDSEEELVEALSSGADDFIGSAVRCRELVARVGAVLRRRLPAHFGRGALPDTDPYHFDLVAKCVHVAGVPVMMTDKEFELSLFLFRNLGRVISRGHLLESVWGSSLSNASRTVDTHISRIRRKLGLRPEVGFRLSAAYGSGYRLDRVGVDWQASSSRPVGCMLDEKAGIAA